MDADRVCRRHGAALLDFVDHGEIGPGTGAAFQHLDRCTRCTAMLDSTVLTVAALRRLGDQVARVEPRTDTWPGLRARLPIWRPSRVSLVSPLAAMVMTVAFCSLLVGPINLGATPTSDAAAALTLWPGLPG